MRRLNADGSLHERQYARVGWHTYNVGTFFVTFSTLNKVHYFGRVENGEMLYTDIGRKAADAIIGLPSHYNDVSIPLWVVMPNHIHLIVKIGSGDSSEGVIPFEQRMPLIKGSNRSRLSSIIGNLKAEVSRFAKTNQLQFAWNPRFHEHIIFNEIREKPIFDYIENNIKKWEENCFK